MLKIAPLKLTLPMCLGTLAVWGPARQGGPSTRPEESFPRQRGERLTSWHKAQSAGHRWERDESEGPVPSGQSYSQPGGW